MVNEKLPASGSTPLTDEEIQDLLCELERIYPTEKGEPTMPETANLKNTCLYNCYVNCNGKEVDHGK